MGRPPLLFSQETADEICERLIDGESLRSICKDSNIPSHFTVFKWINEHPSFAAQYACARELQADTLFDEILEIANTPQMGKETKRGDNGYEEKEGDMIQHRRLQIDARKWMAGKLRPKKYGEVKTPDADDGTVKIEGGLPD